MKSFILAIILLLGVSLGQASTGTIIDHLKDGFDAVYKFDLKTTVSYNHQRHSIPLYFDVHLRKSTLNDPEKFVMHLENARAEQGPYRINVKEMVPSISDPIIFTVHNKELDQVYATEGDIERSVDIKNSVLAMMFGNVTEQLMKDNSSRCEIPVTHKETEDQFVEEISIKRDECSAKLLIETVPDSGVTDVETESVYYFDKVTRQLLRSSSKTNGTFVKDFEVVAFSVEADFYFDGYKEIHDIFDETENTKMYKKPMFIENLVH